MREQGGNGLSSFVQRRRICLHAVLRIITGIWGLIIDGSSIFCLRKGASKRRVLSIPARARKHTHAHTRTHRIQSYNPPAEYLPTQEEIEEWENTAPEDRKRNFLPQKYSSLRLVPRYDNYIQERFERCLDLYLCPRARKTRVWTKKAWVRVCVVGVSAAR